MLTQNGRVIAGTLEGDAGRADRRRDADRRQGLPRDGIRDAGVRHRHAPRRPMLVAEEDLQDAISENTLGIFLILVTFLIFQIAFALTAARSLRLQTTRLLDAEARQISGSNCSSGPRPRQRPSSPSSAPGSTPMARQLEGRLEELQLERARLQETVGASVSRWARAWTATRCWTSSCRRRSTASRRVRPRRDPAGQNGTLAEAARVREPLVVHVRG